LVVMAVDGVGHTDATEPVCFEPQQGNFFEPLCSAVPGVPAPPPVPFGGLLLFTLALARWRVRREWSQT
jgi:hypothetical protein